jgi:hypothetical protein
VDPELKDDWLEKALASRRTAAPPQAFTRSVVDRVQAGARRSGPTELVAEHGVRAGLALAAFGLCLVVDLERLAAALGAALHTPEATTAIAIVAICLAWVLTRKEPGSEAL